jgi:hypothetical protein
MANTLTFYPVGNGDTSLIKLQNGRWVLMDYRHQAQGEDAATSVIDLAQRLREELDAARRNDFDVVGFTHADADHIGGCTDFFYLDHASRYQKGTRARIKTLWVPAAMILDKSEDATECSECDILRQEARHRLKHNYGVRVFSRPKELEAWLARVGLSLESRQHLITDAGRCAPEFTIGADSVEFFCHSPFVKHCEGGDVLRNESGLVFNVRFEIAGRRVQYFAIGDADYGVLEDIVDITTYHGNEDRLDWHLYKAPHHCSYTALSTDKGAKETTPTEGVASLLKRGQTGGYVVASCNPIDAGRDAEEQAQPPHIQAKRCYTTYLGITRGRRVIVTMEEPDRLKPEPITFEITALGLQPLTKTRTGAAAAAGTVPPRAG